VNNKQIHGCPHAQLPNPNPQNLPTENMKESKGKVAVITGAASGIELAIVVSGTHEIQFSTWQYLPSCNRLNALLAAGMKVIAADFDATALATAEQVLSAIDVTDFCLTKVFLLLSLMVHTCRRTY
jgi:hypothetical protein